MSLENQIRIISTYMWCKKIFLRSILSVSILTLATAPVAAQNEYWHQKVSLYELLSVGPDDIVFLGNSITDGGEFAELFADNRIKNRGISADVISGVMKRLHQVTDGKPAKIFLLIGINDVSHGLSAERIAARYEELVKEIRKRTPGTRLYVQSVMPIDNSFGRYKNLKGREKVIPDLNRRIERIADENGAVYIDLWPALSNGKGRMRKDFTNDGLHLTGKGYNAWVEAIKQYVE